MWFAIPTPANFQWLRSRLWFEHLHHHARLGRLITYFLTACRGPLFFLTPSNNKSKKILSCFFPNCTDTKINFVRLPVVHSLIMIIPKISPHSDPIYKNIGHVQKSTSCQGKSKSHKEFLWGFFLHCTVWCLDYKKVFKPQGQLDTHCGFPGYTSLSAHSSVNINIPFRNSTLLSPNLIWLGTFPCRWWL